ncbi:rhomboid family intramembrane serine protease [Deinococcus irradiatisoli]|uniref:rhomboid family intramembrane serine protease n=1 Tax=Deinococcus irradiatisoli TaxID=2202254 RepID=UPI001FE70DA2|nr:rhomboid family intramembrane serine protease [Deinococcus irradiatisoli]
MSGPVRPGASRPPQRVRGAGLLTAALLASLWLEELSDQLVFGGHLDAYGIVPRHLSSLGHIFTAPFLHADFVHLIGNTLPLAILAFLSALGGAARFVLATLIIVVLGGGLVWLLARAGNHLGASELVFGYFGLLLASAWHERRPASLLTAGLALLLYGGALWGVLPSGGRISWESHLFGFVAGVVAAGWLRGARQPQQKKPRRLA